MKKVMRLKTAATIPQILTGTSLSTAPGSGKANFIRKNSGVLQRLE